jgi:hypothetical protein
MNSPTEQHLGAAFRDLVAEQPFTPDVLAIECRARQARRRARIARGGIGAGVVAVAAVAAVGVASAVPTGPAGTNQASGAHPAKISAPASSPGSADTQLPLVTLAANVAAEPQPKGDATLVESKTGINRWDLYADDGRYFFSLTEAGLSTQVEKNNSDQGTSEMLRLEIAAAKYAVKGDLDTAALKMALPFDPPVGTFASVREEDAQAWENSVDPLIAGSGNPQVRAGVLRLASALVGVTVTYGTAGGQPTITLTGESGYDGPKNSPKAKGAGPDRYEALTINADTGIPLKFTVALGSPGKVFSTTTYVVTRVNLADVAAGKF